MYITVISGVKTAFYVVFVLLRDLQVNFFLWGLSMFITHTIPNNLPIFMVIGGNLFFGQFLSGPPTIHEFVRWGKTAYQRGLRLKLKQPGWDRIVDRSTWKLPPLISLLQTKQLLSLPKSILIPSSLKLSIASNQPSTTIVIVHSKHLPTTSTTTISSTASASSFWPNGDEYCFWDFLLKSVSDPIWNYLWILCANTIYYLINVFDFV